VVTGTAVVATEVVGVVVESPGIVAVVGTDDGGSVLTGAVVVGTSAVVSYGTPRLGKVSTTGDDSSRATV
jgi:hypothetical protein